MSAAISRLTAIAASAGLKSEDGQWSKAFVHWYDCPMPEDIRQAGEANPHLTYIETDATPHTPATEGFKDNEHPIAISFLRAL
ncbi:MAG: hypothetical protein KA233_04210 [Novosphingobium sp.]|nr:hypothetical protein [Novosphingobium sp.]MBP6554865.1 hypothetical protein [Novosphingobium sp.]